MSSEKRHYLVEQQEEGQSNKSTDANNEGQSRKFTAKRGRFFFKKKPENAEEATTSSLEQQQQLQADIDAEREIALEHCLHEIIIKDMCGNCGKDLRVRGGFSGERMEPTVANVSMIHHVPELIVSNEIANKLGARDHENILNHRKLILLVDLDQTLVHTSNRPPKPSEVGTMDMFGYRLLGNTFFTKIRPHTRHFLERINKLYEMHIVTFGQRMYAHKIAELLDPNKKYFDYRVLSRDELLSSTHKTVNLKALFPCSEQLIVMLDDRPDVWMHSEALIRVKPYRFFVEVGDINAPPQDLPSKIELPTVDTQNPAKNKEEIEQNKKEEEEKPLIDQQSKNGTNEEVEADNERTRTERPDNSTENVANDESDSMANCEINGMANCEINGNGGGSPDGQEQQTTASPPPQAAVDELSQPVSPVADDDNALEHIERILIRVHSLFYQQYDRDNKQVPDMKRIVGWLRSQVLAGECIVFSGLVPLGVDIRACEIYRLCTQFGAKVDDKIVEGQTTVLVAAKAATEKSVQAERLGIPIVSTRWLEACFDRWQKVDKTDFLFCNED